MARVAFLGALLSASVAGATPDSDLRLAQNAYQYGDYKNVIAVLRPLLYPNVQLDSADQVVEARRMLGLSYLFSQDEAAAEREFVALLTVRPDAKLDPLRDPPPFVQIFERIKARMREQLDEVRRRYERERAAKEKARHREIDDLKLKIEEYESTAYVMESTENSRLVAMVPFGAGQFQNGHTKKGVFFLISELALGVTSAVLAVSIRLKWPDGVFATEERDEADTLASAQVITGAAFLAVAIWGVVDANLYFQPRRAKPARRIPRTDLQVSGSLSGLVLRF